MPAMGGVSYARQRATRVELQISVLRDNDRWQLYCCHTLRMRDMAGNPHVLSVGIDLVPALTSTEGNHEDIAQTIGEDCVRHGGQAKIGQEAVEAIRSVANILSIAWVEEALRLPHASSAPAAHAAHATASAAPRPRNARVTSPTCDAKSSDP